MPTSTHKNNSHKSKKRNNSVSKKRSKSVSKKHKNSKRKYSLKNNNMRGAGNEPSSADLDAQHELERREQLAVFLASQEGIDAQAAWEARRDAYYASDEYRRDQEAWEAGRVAYLASPESRRDDEAWYAARNRRIQADKIAAKTARRDAAQVNSRIQEATRAEKQARRAARAANPPAYNRNNIRNPPPRL